jgi:hypothetical protein
MTSKTKSTIDMALGTATCCSFAVPEVGALIGGGIASGQFVFDLFFPSDSSYDPADMGASRSDIDQSTSTILSAINDAAFTTHRDNVATFANDFQEIWKRMQVKPDGLSPATWASVSSKLKAQCDSYFNDATATDNLKNAIRWMEAHNCPNDMVSIYLLAIGLLIAYHKTALNWDINAIVDTFKASQADYDDFVKRFQAWKNPPNNRQGAPPLTIRKPVAPTTQEMVSTSYHATTLREDILPEFIGKATTIHDGWQSRWDGRKKKISDAYKQFATKNPALEPLQKQIKWGATFAYQYNVLTTQLNLTGIDTESDIQKVGATIDKWKAIKADLDSVIGQA